MAQYHIEVMQWADGSWMTSWKPELFDQLHAAQDAAQALSNEHGTITRVAPYGSPYGEPELMPLSVDYFWPGKDAS